MHNCQPCMKDYAHKQKPSPGRVLQRRQRINICWLADRWIDRVNEAWQHCCSVTSETVNLKSWLWHPYTHTHTLHTHTHTHTPEAIHKQLPEKLHLCCKVVLYQGTQPLFMMQNHMHFQTCSILAIFLSETRRVSSGFSPPCPQAHFEIYAAFEDGPTNKLSYFCYATTNGEKEQSSRWTIIWTIRSNQ